MLIGFFLYIILKWFFFFFNIRFGLHFSGNENLTEIGEI
jgi:hypothetical protein